MAQRIQLAAEQKYAGRWSRSVGDSTATADEDHGGHDEGDKSKGQNGRAEQVVGQWMAGC